MIAFWNRGDYHFVFCLDESFVIQDSIISNWYCTILMLIYIVITFYFDFFSLNQKKKEKIPRRVILWKNRNTNHPTNNF